MILSPAAVAALQDRGVKTPAYDRSNVTIGIVHFGPGAFHRVHQACYVDDVLSRDARWGICEVSLRSTGVRDVLVPQDGLYTIAILDEQSSFRVIGSVKEVLVAPESPSAVLDRMVNPATRLVTATITEKGYCLSKEGGLDFAHPDIAHDLQNPTTPRTFVGFLAQALHRRREHRHEPFNVVSCDNLADNGHRLRRAVLEFVRPNDPSLTDDVAGFERAKLRLLNGAHSTLAYVGSLAGFETVSRAMNDATLSSFIRRMMIEDIRAGLAAPAGLDLDRYIDAILRRFRNPAIRHLLSQIAWDGSQKLPFRILPTIAENLTTGRSISRLCVPLAAWFRFIRRQVRDQRQIVDPLASQLTELAQRCNGEPSHDVAAFLSLEKVFNAEFAATMSFRSELETTYAQLASVEGAVSLADALKRVA